MAKTPKVEVKKFDAEVGKVLQLMIHSLYTNKDIFLRELISNASDACDKLRYQSIEKPEIASSDLKIEVLINKDAGTVTVRDNGIGMSKQDLIDNLGTIASSGTQKFINQISENPKADVSLIGQFGVGFYSAFMVGDNITVITTKAGTDDTYQWQSNGQGEYSIAKAEEKHPAGTSIIIKLKDSEVEYLEKYRLRHIISTYSDHISFPIELTDENGKMEKVNTASALWTRPKSEITDEQYNEFYHHVAHQPDTPWLRIHNKVEGTLEFTNLLYIPSTKPFDLFHPDRKSRVKLYVKRVFITDEGVKLIPTHMRFLRGVVDSEDLPLNISRETLQHNAVIDKIRKSVVKKVLSELKAKAKDDEKSYNQFWQNFGEVMKEGLCEGAMEDKEQLLEVCRFNSTKADSMTSLDDYILRMLDTQEQIYYITGDNLDALKKHPQLEGFAKRGIEVLLLADHVDDFWVHVISQYKNKELVSINSASIDLDTIKKVDREEKEVKENKSVTEYIQKVLGEQVKEVRVSTKLVDSPSCIAIPQGAMSIRMEKYLIDQKQLKVASAKILEINMEHPIVQKIAADVEQSNASSNTEDLVYIIYDQACVLEGENLKDPQGFMKRLNKIISQSIAA